jgi:hypothetical protein
MSDWEYASQRERFEAMEADDEGYVDPFEVMDEYEAHDPNIVRGEQ